jgi:hypothetical protein
MELLFAAAHESACGTKPTSPSPWPMSDAEGKADIELSMLEVSF